MSAFAQERGGRLEERKRVYVDPLFEPSPECLSFELQGDGASLERTTDILASLEQHEVALVSFLIRGKQRGSAVRR